LQGESVKDLATKFGTPEWSIKEANRGKHFVKGEWIFIPMRRGLLSQGDFISRYGSGSNPVVPLGSGNYMWPVPSSRKISSKFGPRWGRHHDGIDIPAKLGTHILATNSGVVVYSGSKLGGYGNLIVISHADGFFSVYAHAKKSFVRKGSRVHRGQVIAQVGTTGRSTGPHLHFEIRTSERPYNPVTFFKRDFVSTHLAKR
jgi:murein DD-endopeptidase MepM/ murein hydrolase activator NlpD